jgi:hypothetical protein
MGKKSKGSGKLKNSEILSSRGITPAKLNQSH